MNRDTVPSPGRNSTGFPFDPILLVAGFLRRSPVLFLALALGAGAGYLTATRYMTRTWTSKAVLLRSAAIDQSSDSLGLLALSRMLTLPDVLGRLRKDLELSARLEDLERNVDVEVQPRTGIMTVAYTDSDPDRAARTVGRLVQLFQETMQGVREKQVARQLEYCRTRSAEVRREVVAVEERLRLFKEQHGIVDLDAEIVGVLDRYNRIDARFREAEGAARAVECKLASLDDVVATVERQLRAERQQATDADSITNMKQKSLRLQQQIKELRQSDEWRLQMAKLEQDLGRVESLVKEGYVPEVKAEQLRLERDLLETKMVESPEIQALRVEIERIDRLLLPTTNNNSVNLLLKDTMIRRFKLRLDAAAAQKTALVLKAARDRVAERFVELPEREAELADLRRQLSSLTTYEGTLMGRQDELRVTLAGAAPTFRLLDPPTVPRKPGRSRRTVVAAAMAGGSVGLAALLILGLEFRRLEIRVGRELPGRLGIPLLAVLTSEGGGEEPGEALRAAAHALSGPEEPSPRVLLVLGTEPGAGAAAVARGLARRFVARGSRVVLVSSEPAEGLLPLAGLLGRPSLAEADVELLGSRDMARAMMELRVANDLTLVVGPPLTSSLAVRLLSWHADGVVLVVPSGCSTSWALGAALEEAGLARDCVLGGILTGASPELERLGGFFHA